MIGRIIASEVDRAAREKAARNHAAARRYPPMQPAPPPRRSGPAVAFIATVCGLGTLALVITLLTEHHNQQGTVLANQQTCSMAWQWAPGYDTGLADEIGPASLTPDPQLRGDVQALLNAVQAAPVTGDATVPPTRAVRAAMHALMGRCGQMGLNPGGNDSSSIP